MNVHHEDSTAVIYYNDVESGTAENDKPRRVTKSGILLWGLAFLGMMLLTMSVALMVLMYFNVQYIKVSGSSMSPTITNGDGVFLSTRDDDPQTDDIVVFVSPEWRTDSEASETTHDDEGRYFIKRVIAVPGDTITLSSEKVKVNGDVHYPDENSGRLNPLSCLNTQTVEYELGDDEYFIMGDNYPYSTDAYAMHCHDAERDEILVSREDIEHFGDNVITLPGGFSWFERGMEN